VRTEPANKLHDERQAFGSALATSVKPAKPGDTKRAKGPRLVVLFRYLDEWRMPNAEWRIAFRRRIAFAPQSLDPLIPAPSVPF